jgi:hypothetical protein
VGALGGFWERLEGLVSAGRVLKALEIAEGSYSDLVAPEESLLKIRKLFK